MQRILTKFHRRKDAKGAEVLFNTDTQKIDASQSGELFFLAQTQRRKAFSLCFFNMDNRKINEVNQVKLSILSHTDAMALNCIEI